MVPIHIIVFVCAADSRTASRAKEKSWEASSRPNSAQVFDRDDRNMWYLGGWAVRLIHLECKSTLKMFGFNSHQTNNALVLLFNSFLDLCML